VFFGAVVVLFILAYCAFLFCARRSQGDVHNAFIQQFASQMASALNGLPDANVINYITTNMQKSTFKAAVHTSSKECSICLVEFVEGTEITELPCDKRHYFHTICIQTWISTHRNINCPLCKKDINIELHRMEEQKMQNVPQILQELNTKKPDPFVINMDSK
jgi:hypothetical protein